MDESRGSSCPSAKELSAYARDELDTSVAPAYDRHLAQCDDCRDRYIESLGRQLLVPNVPNSRVVKEIGRGRFGVVYKAWWLTETPRLVALKVLSSVGEMEQRRFEREIAVLRHLDAPGVVRFLDAGGAGDSDYFIMDYVEGVHFDEFVRDESKSRDDKLAVFERVCRIVALAHEHGVIHRDLKPRNIIVDEHDQPHVLDFGICSVDSLDKSSWALGTLTHAGDVIGTLRYMSPEQAWGGVAGPIDERSDVWSLGIMLYELVTDGAYPYPLAPSGDRTAHEALLERIRKEMPRLPRLDTLPRGRDLETLLERCLCWEPQERIASVSTLGEDIAAYRQGRRIATRPLSIPRRVRRIAVGAATRSRWSFAVCFVAIVAASLSTASIFGAISWKEPVLIGVQHGAWDKELPASDAARDAIVIVGLSDQDVPALVEYARQVGMNGVSGNARTWRGLHARLMTRFVAARPRAVAWDYHFTSDQPEDADLADSILALERVGVPVILACDSYDEYGVPDLSPMLTDRLGDALRHGSINIREQTQRAGEFVVITRSIEGVVVPSLWLATLAGVLHPDARLEVDWRHRIQAPTMVYAVGPGLYRRERDELGLSRSFTAAGRHEAPTPGGLVGAVRMDRGDPRRWESQTISYDQLLRSTDAELRDEVAGRILLVGDLRSNPAGSPADRHDVAFAGETFHDVPGCYLVAEAIAGLIAREYVHAPIILPPKLMLLVLALAIAGCLLPIRLAVRRWLEPIERRRRLSAGLIAAFVVSFGCALTLSSFAAVWTSIAAFALTLPLAGSFWVEFVRNRHRVAERERSVIEGFGFESAGTLTLPRRRLTSTPEIR